MRECLHVKKARAPLIPLNSSMMHELRVFAGRSPFFPYGAKGRHLLLHSPGLRPEADRFHLLCSASPSWRSRMRECLYAKKAGAPLITLHSSKTHELRVFAGRSPQPKYGAKGRHLFFLH